MRLLAVLLAVASSSLVFRADALALGDIEVRSMLNEPLDARVPLVAASASELSTLVVSPASAAAFETAGLELTSYVAGLQFEVVSGTPPFVRIRGRTPAREPFLDLLLEFSWGSGRLLRNYTVLLDPPAIAFEPVAQAEPAPEPPRTEAPVTDVAPPSPAPQPVPEPQVNTPQPVTDPAFNEGVGWVEDVPPAPTPSAPTRREPAPSAPSVSNDGSSRYGPVDKKETLWSIAYRLRPSLSLTMDQMQLAMFYANPEAFDGNLNTLKAGAMLSVPSAADIASIDPAAAKQEVARQRNTYVPPPEATRSTPPAARPAPVTRSKPKPVVEPEPAPTIAEAEPEPKAEPAPPEPEPVTEEPSAAQTPEPAPAEESETVAEAATPPRESQPATPERPMSALERLRAQQAGRAVPEPTPSESVTVDDEPAEPQASEPEPEPAAPPQRPRQPIAAPAPVDDEGGFPWLIALLVLLVGGGAGYWFWKRRQAGEESTPTWPSAPASTVAADEEPEPAAEPDEPVDAPDETDDADLLSATAVFDADDTVADEPAESDAADDLDATAIFDAGTAAPPVDEAPEPTPASESTQQFHSETITIDVSGDDPVAEADFHLAYGLYEEAALLLQQAMDADPARADVKAKLAEVYFAASDRDQFVDLAARTKDDLPAAEWQRVVIMGQQLAPDEPLFQQDETTDFDDGGIDLDFDADPAAEAAPATDFDLGDFEGDEQPAAPDDDHSLEFDIEPPVVDESADEAPSPDNDDHSLEFDLEGFESETPVDETAESTVPDDVPTGAPQTDVEADIQDHLAFDIDTMTSDEPLYPDAGESEQTADDVLADLGDFEVGSTDDGKVGDAPQDGDDTAVETPESGTGEAPSMEPESPGPESMAGDLAQPETGADDADFGDGEDFLGDLDDFVVDADEQPSVEPDGLTAGGDEPADMDDGESTDSAAGDDVAFDFDLDDFDLEGETSAAADESASAAPDEAEVDLAQFDLDSDAPVEPEQAPSEDAADFDLDAMLGDDGGDDMPSLAGDDGDVGSKLDLARAYVDMGDAEMANTLIDDVLAGGSDEQKAEASALRERLSGGA
ncbi:FimV/HubP family polar landmark protein [uncultured Abyssibacter sp.]|uniref:FimV/HubP family polar landmark protein n=1 Tax=uncultured Abyssibacter sp. TaxID=2320202 RepID=UPI0032B184A1